MNTFKQSLILFAVALRLGLTSFGGPVAHLSYFHHEYVIKRKWLSEQQYGELVAIAQFLPGPTSSQVGFAIGLKKGGTIGGISSFIGFTLPSAIILTTFALVSVTTNDHFSSIVHMLKLVAVAVIAQAILAMMKSFTPDIFRQTMAVLSIAIVLMYPTSLLQLGAILICGLLSLLMYKQKDSFQVEHEQLIISKKAGLVAIGLFVIILVVTPLLSNLFNNSLLTLFEKSYIVGTFVFGGGHVMLPLLEQQFVGENLLTKEQFLSGYGIAQGMPGPLFTFVSFIGAELHHIGGAMIATLAIFLPGLLLMMSIIPFWQQIRQNSSAHKFVVGMNASVVGILIASFFTPVWQSSILSTNDFIITTVMFYMIQGVKLPVWTIVLLAIALGLVL